MYKRIMCDVSLVFKMGLFTGYVLTVFIKSVIYSASDRPSESLDTMEKADNDDEENC